MEGGYRHAVADAGGSRPDVPVKLGEQLAAHLHALLEYGSVGSVPDALDELIHLRGLYARQVVAHACVEHEAVLGAQAVKPADYAYCEPSLDVLVKGLGNIQLGGPLAVVALVLGPYAGAVDAGGKVVAVHLLYSLELKEAGAGIVCGHYILCKLGVRACGGAEGGLQLFFEQGKGLAVLFYIGRVYAEDGAEVVVLLLYPGHKLLKGYGSHSFAHDLHLRMYYFSFSRSACSKASLKLPWCGRSWPPRLCR